jgi:hypothetical protein
MAYVFDVWLRYEGIVGYTSDIFEVLRAVGFNIDMQEDW